SHFLFFFMLPLPPRPTLFPYTTLFRSVAISSSRDQGGALGGARRGAGACEGGRLGQRRSRDRPADPHRGEHHRNREGLAEGRERSEEHTSELQSPYDLVCRLLLEKKKK